MGDDVGLGNTVHDGQAHDDSLFLVDNRGARLFVGGAVGRVSTRDRHRAVRIDGGVVLSWTDVLEHLGILGYHLAILSDDATRRTIRGRHARVEDAAAGLEQLRPRRSALRTDGSRPGGRKVSGSVRIELEPALASGPVRIELDLRDQVALNLQAAE